MAEEKQSPIGIIVVVAVIAVVAGIFLFKGGSNNGDQNAGNQQQPTNGSDTNETTPPPEPAKPKKPTEPEEPAFIKESLVAYYPFNGNAKDESGNGHDGEVNGSTLTADRYGAASKAYSFDGSNDYISASGKFPLGSSPRSLTFWARPTKTTGSENIIGWGQSVAGKAFGAYAAHDLGRNGLYFYGHGVMNTHDFSANFTVDSKKVAPIFHHP